MTKAAEARLIRKLEKKLDVTLSRYIRAKTWEEFGGKCPLCLRGPIIPCRPCKRNRFATECQAIQCCFHFIRRIRKPTRWMEVNLIGACHGCNRMEYRNPDISRLWLIGKYGADTYISLIMISMKNWKPEVGWLEDAIRTFEAKLATLLLLDETRAVHNPVLLSLRKGEKNK